MMIMLLFCECGHPIVMEQSMPPGQLSVTHTFRDRTGDGPIVERCPSCTGRLPGSLMIGSATRETRNEASGGVSAVPGQGMSSLPAPADGECREVAVGGD